MYTQPINMEINKPYLLPILMKQFDTDRVLRISIKDNGLPYSLRNKVVKLYGLKSDETIVFKGSDIEDIVNGIINVKFTNQMLAVDGLSLYELVIYDGDGEGVLSNIPFSINVIKSVRTKNDMDTIVTESQNEITAFEEALKKIGDYEADMNTFKYDVTKLVNDKFSDFENRMTTAFDSLTVGVVKEMRSFYNKMYPIGSIIERADSTNPAKLYGGKWEQYGQGQVTIGQGSHTDINGTTYSFKVNNEYGVYARKLTQENTPYMPSGQEAKGFTLSPEAGGFADRVAVTRNANEQTTFDIVQPSVGVYRWRRTGLANIEESDIVKELANAIKTLGINTSALQDGAVTYPKLSTDLQEEIDKIDNISTTNSQLSQQFKDIVASAGDSNTEIVVSRTDSYANSYATLGDRLAKYDNGILVYDDIITLKADNKLHEGQIVYIKGYYDCDKFSSHMRVIGTTDNGFGELLSNGLYANLLYQNDEINITFIGARNSYNDNYVIYDIVPYLKKITTKGLTAFVPSGWWALSYFNFAKHGLKIKGCSMQPFFNGENHTENVATTVLFPYSDNQEVVLHHGVNNKEVRGSLLEGFQIVTNAMEYSADNEFVPKYDSGAKIGLKLETETFSKVRDLIITGTNTNAEYGIWYNGCETFFRDIMFRRYGVVGGAGKYAFYSVNRHEDSETGAIAMSVSGHRYENISFEGVGIPHANIVGTDVSWDGSNIELGFIKVANGHTYEVVKYEDIPDGEIVNHKALFNINDGCNDFIFNNITIQKLGQTYKHEWTDSDGTAHVEYDVWDGLFGQSSDYLNHVYFTYDNIMLQETKKDINIVYFPDNLSYRDLVNKGVIGVGLVTIDNYSANIVLRDNIGVQLPQYRNIIPKTNNALSINNYRTNFNNNTLYPNDSCLQHGVRWNSDKQCEYFAPLTGGNTYTSAYANYLAVFNVDEYLVAGTHALYFYYANRLNTPITMNIVFTLNDGSTRTDAVSFPATNNASTKILKYSYTIGTDARIKKIEFKDVSDSRLKLYRVDNRLG